MIGSGHWWITEELTDDSKMSLMNVMSKVKVIQQAFLMLADTWLWSEEDINEIRPYDLGYNFFLILESGKQKCVVCLNRVVNCCREKGHIKGVLELDGMISEK